MKILVAGLNHNTADIEIREKVAFNKDKLREGLTLVKNLPYIDEVVILSTCNRVELYAGVRDTEKASESIKNFLTEFHNIDRSLLDKSIYLYNDVNAVRHIFRVASSLDSMVIGEPQILGQLKEAYEFALENKTTGILLNKLMKKAISVAKRVRTETRIAENAVSISFAAVELAKKIFTDLSGKVFMLLGAGEMAELAAKHLMNNGVKEVIVANRRYERACELAKEFNGRPVSLENFLREIVHSDIIICSTGAPNYILLKEQMQKVMKERKQRQVFIIDISVPRNIDPKINDLDNVFLYNIDDLQGIVDANMFERKKEADKAEKIVEEEIIPYFHWLSSLESFPTIIALRKRAEKIKNDEIEKLLNRFPDIDEKKRKAIEYMASSIVNKLIHPPTTALKKDSEDRDLMVAIIKKLYGINDEESR
ncbi:MAG: glutamyl-tRNA reductase [Nitrospirae bacterium]|nr:glutamyl-tRNA reductase [Nitrospirota bacterium]